LDPSAEPLRQRMNATPGRVATDRDQQMGRMTHPTRMWQGHVTCASLRTGWESVLQTFSRGAKNLNTGGAYVVGVNHPSTVVVKLDRRTDGRGGRTA